MAISNFTPIIWSETLHRILEKQYIAVAHCNRDFEGEIRQCGDTVRICGTGNITVGNYTKNTDMGLPEEIDTTMRELTINQAKYFNFQLDDIDRAQSKPDLMKHYMKNAASALQNEADKYIFTVCKTAPLYMRREATVANIIDTIIEARTKLYAQNVTDSTELYLEISPVIAELIFKAKVELATNNTDVLENGCIGSLMGCKIYVSNNIPTEENENGDTINYCFMRTKAAVTFAEQLSEIEAYRPENRFADAVKGLHLYGARIYQPNQIVQLILTTPGLIA